jgi:hypothetical protein
MYARYKLSEDEEELRGWMEKIDPKVKGGLLQRLARVERTRRLGFMVFAGMIGVGSGDALLMLRSHFHNFKLATVIAAVALVSLTLSTRNVERVRKDLFTRMVSMGYGAQLSMMRLAALFHVFDKMNHAAACEDYCCNTHE